MTDETAKPRRGLSRAAGAAAAAEEAAIEKARRQRAARDAVSTAEAVPPKMVTCRVLPLGDGKIAMGVHVAGVGDACYDRGELFQAPEDLALVHEGHGYLEIMPETEPDA